MEMDRQARVEFQRLVRAGMKQQDARAFVLSEQRDRQRASRDRMHGQAVRASKRAAWADATNKQIEAQRRGEILSRADALKLAGAPLRTPKAPPPHVPKGKQRTTKAEGKRLKRLRAEERTQQAWDQRENRGAPSTSTGVALTACPFEPGVFHRAASHA